MYSVCLVMVLAAAPGQLCRPLCRPPCQPQVAPPVVEPSEAPEAKPAPKPAWKPHSWERPRPLVITPPTESTQESPGEPPSDAVVLFDGSSLDAWESTKRNEDGERAEPGWKVEDGVLEVVPGSGSIETKDRFGDIQLHLEWSTPTPPKGKSQGRGNSGIKLLPLLEVQVLDSYENDTYPDGQAAAIYGKYPPLVNASREPGQWQYYDIVFYAPEVEDGKMVKPGSVTVFHNGILVHHAADITGTAERVRLHLQDHGNPVRYRNIWLRELHPYDFDGEQVVEPPPGERVEAAPPEEVEPSEETEEQPRVYVPQRRRLFPLFRRWR